MSENKSDMLQENNNFYFQKDNVKIDSFILIPKILLTNEKYKSLTILAKMMYALYLNRYSSTIYKDKNGPYIIFSDKDIGDMLNACRSAVVKNRNALKEAGLIDFVRSTGNNKIYLFNFTSETSNDIFFHKSDIENMRFIRFPIDFFEDEFDNLPLTSKFIYSLYYDLMCLSQAYYYTDNQERIYFQENIDDQVKRFGLNSNTIRKYREYLKACDLLFEYLPFDSSIRYYILKLSNYKNNVDEFEKVLKLKSKKEKNEYLKKVSAPLLDYFITKTKEYDVSILKEKRKRCELTYKNAVDLFAKNNIIISIVTYKSYENGNRRIKANLFEKINSIYDEILNEIDEAFESKKNIKSEAAQNVKNHNLKYYDVLNLNGTTPLIDTTDTQKHKKQTMQYVGDIHDVQSIQNIQSNTKNIDNIIYQINDNPINDIEKNFLIDAFKYLQNLNQFYMKSKGQFCSMNEMLDLLYSISYIELLTISLEIFRNIRLNSDYKFDTPEKMMNFFITCLLDKLENLKENNNSQYNWFNKIVESKNQYTHPINNANEVVPAKSNYKWWEE